MHIPGLPEEISGDSVRAAHEALGLPWGEGRITKVELVPGSVIVTFFRESEDTAASPAESKILVGGRESLACVTVPIVVRRRETPKGIATVADGPTTPGL